MLPNEQLAAELHDTSARLARTFRSAKDGVEAIDIIDEARLVIDRVANRLDPAPLQPWNAAQSRQDRAGSGAGGECVSLKTKARTAVLSDL